MGPCITRVMAEDRGELLAAADADFTGSVPEHYERDLGPVIFDGYAADLARRAAARLRSRSAKWLPRRRLKASRARE